MAETSTRDVRDPRALRALAHPLRLRLLEELAAAGTATATQLADWVGESPANCSWHLRQLARYGFVEESGGGSGRKRPWRVADQSNRWGSPDDDPEMVRVGDAATEMLVSREYEQLRTWHRSRRQEPAEWRHAGFVTQSGTWLTPEEIGALHEEIGAILVPYLDRISDPSRRPPDARSVRFVAWCVPRTELRA